MTMEAVKMASATIEKTGLAEADVIDVARLETVGADVVLGMQALREQLAARASALEDCRGALEDFHAELVQEQQQLEQREARLAERENRLEEWHRQLEQRTKQLENKARQIPEGLRDRYEQMTGWEEGLNKRERTSSSSVSGASRPWPRI